MILEAAQGVCGQLLRGPEVTEVAPSKVRCRYHVRHSRCCLCV
jgi:hypothetical protein